VRVRLCVPVKLTKPTVQRLGRHRWVVERSLAWLAQHRRLAIRYERRDDIHEAFLTLGCINICLNFLEHLDRF
jgi:transposase